MYQVWRRRPDDDGYAPYRDGQTFKHFFKAFRLAERVKRRFHAWDVAVFGYDPELGEWHLVDTVNPYVS